MQHDSEPNDNGDPKLTSFDPESDQAAQAVVTLLRRIRDLNVAGRALAILPARPAIQQLIDAGYLTAVPQVSGPLAVPTGQLWVRLTKLGAAIAGLADINEPAVAGEPLCLSTRQLRQLTQQDRATAVFGLLLCVTGALLCVASGAITASASTPLPLGLAAALGGVWAGYLGVGCIADAVPRLRHGVAHAQLDPVSESRLRRLADTYPPVAKMLRQAAAAGRPLTYGDLANAEAWVYHRLHLLRHAAGRVV